MGDTIICQECAESISFNFASYCIQCTKAFCQSCVEKGPGYLGATCSLECLELFEDSISNTSPGGQVFITGKTSSDMSKRLDFRIGLDRQTFQEPHCAIQLRHDFASECDPTIRPFFAGGRQYPCFDNYFHAGKVMKDINPTYTQQWFLTLSNYTGKYPPSPGRDRIFDSWHLCDGSCRSRVYYCSCPYYTKESAYTEILVPTYIQLLGESPVMQLLRGQLARGRDIILYDPAYTPSSPDRCDLVSFHAVEAAQNVYCDPIPYGLLVAGKLLNINGNSLS